MAEIFILKSLKVLLSIICYTSGGIILLNQLAENKILENINIDPTAHFLIMWMLVVLFVLKIVWYVIDKCLQYKERVQNLREARQQNKKKK